MQPSEVEEATTPDTDGEDPELIPSTGSRWIDRGGHPIIWLVGAWVALNSLWLWTNRRSRVFEIDEAGYASTAARLARQRTLRGVWQVLHEGSSGPLQAILAAPPQWLRGADPATLLWENVLFGAGTALATYVMAKRLAGRGAGLAAAAIVLLSPGVIDFSRLALTVMPSVFFATVAMAALVVGRGLERGRWAVVAGAAIGFMTLSRSMTVGFVPVFALAALGWVVSQRTPLRIVLRNGVLAVATACLVALWWWVVRWADVSQYLFGGGSADTIRTHDPVTMARAHITELRYYVGYSVPVVAVFAYLGLRVLGFLPRRSRHPATEQAPAIGGSRSEKLAVWPMVLAVAAGVAVLSVSSATGVGFALPLLPWATVATVAVARRTLVWRSWLVWAVIVTTASLYAAVTVPQPGLTSIFWCGGGSTRSNCQVDTDAKGRQWNRAISEVADRIWIAQETRPGNFEVALLSRDLLLNGNTLGLAMELRYRVGVDFYRFFSPEQSREDQIRKMVRHADLLVAAEDFPGPVILGTYQPQPQEALAAARAAGFTPCDEIALPDGRKVTVLAGPSLSPAACA